MMTCMTEQSVRALTRGVVLRHVEAFNEHDTERILRGLDEGVVWTTGTDVYRGRAGLVNVFDDWLWGQDPRLDVVRLVVESDAAAMECIEHMVVEGARVQFPIAVFVTVRRGLLTAVTVYREGNADLRAGDT